MVIGHEVHTQLWVSLTNEIHGLCRICVGWAMWTPQHPNHLQLSTYINLKGSDLTEPHKNAPIGHGFLLQIPQTRDGIGMALVFYIICILVLTFQLQQL